MTATFVPDKITPLSVEELLLAAHDGYQIVMGAETDSAECLAATGAQLCLESGNGQHAHQFNFHNEKRSKDWTGLFTRFKCDEIFDANTAALAQKLGPCVVSPWKGGPRQRVVLLPPHPWTEFVAFETAAQGTARYFEFLSCRERYRRAWKRAFVGDAVGFSLELGAAGYYTADVGAYTAGLASIAKRILPICKRVITGDDYGITGQDREHISAVALSLMETVYSRPADWVDGIASA